MPRPKTQKLIANWQTLQRIFIRPEDASGRKVLVKYMDQILFGLHGFLKDHVGITEEVGLKELAERFQDYRISRHPSKKLSDVIRTLIEDIAPHAVNVASPYFIGHMTAAIPFFMVHLATVTAALNQNPVKLETSKIVSVLERQVLSKIHRMIYGFVDDFYAAHVQNPDSTLGCFVEDGTLANLSALWVARNKLLGPKPGFGGVEKEGVPAAYRAYGLERCVVLVSRLGHYSLEKSAGVLGIGSRNVIPLEVDDKSRINVRFLRGLVQILQSKGQKTKVMAVIGIAGTTETGTVDPLIDIADICAENDIHFHVDAAWGGPVLLSDKYRRLLSGIQRADSVTIDGHKQFYMPMSCGMVYFKDPKAMDRAAYHAAYINRPGSADLGIRSLSGSRAAVSLILGSALEIMGAKGYGLLIDHGVETARAFAEAITADVMFELVTPPELNILTYRIFPPHLRRAWKKSDDEDREYIIAELNRINIRVQRLQREAGKSFVSRTTLQRAGCHDKVVLRAVIMNPMTDMGVIREILDEQKEIYWTAFG